MLGPSISHPVKDLCNCAELAKGERNYLLYAHFLARMSKDCRKVYLNSNEDKQSAMELTIIADNTEYFKELRFLGWGNTNRTMLGFAAEKGSLEIIKWLLEMAPEDEKPKVDGLMDGADDDDVGYRGKTPLYWAAKNGHLNVCQYLVSKGADINRKFFEEEEGSKKHRKYDKLTDQDIPDATRNYINAQRKVLEVRNYYWLESSRTTKPKNVTKGKIVEWVKAGILPNSINSYLGCNWNFYSWAVDSKDTSLVEFLIDNGADVNGKYTVTPDEKRTALMLACEVGDTNLVAKLISSKANLYAHQDNGMSALHYAIKFKNYNCAEMLLDKLDIAKCSLVEDEDDEDLRLNLLQYVGKYCDDLDFCTKLKSWVSAMSDPLKTPFLKFLELREKAEEGNSESQYQLGILYYGLIKNGRKTVYWLDKAAKQNHSGANRLLGECYAAGFGVPKDKNKAKQLYQIAESLEKAKDQPNRVKP